MIEIRIVGAGNSWEKRSKPYKLTGEQAVDRNGCTYSLAIEEDTNIAFAICNPTGGMFDYDVVKLH